MNREKDFKLSSAGTLINTNTKDFHRARRRNKVMKQAATALSENGDLNLVVKEVEKFNNSPSRAESRVATLEEELVTTKKLNKEMSTKLDDALRANQVMQEQLDDLMYIKHEMEELKSMFGKAKGNN